MIFFIFVLIMIQDDVFKTIAQSSEGAYSEKRSKFISFAMPVESEEEAKEYLEEIRKKYYDARHVCWAYLIGSDEIKYRANDDGEPSGTAGRPILGQIRSFELTNVFIAVVRYFGGIKLGTGGLVVAYKAAAADALDHAEIIEKTIDEEVTFDFEYPFMNDVMRIIKDIEPQIVDQTFEMACNMRLRIRRSKMEELRDRLSKVQTVVFADEAAETKKEEN